MALRSLVDEDGNLTAEPRPNAYVPVAFGDTYHEDRANDEWTAATEQQRSGALIKASDYTEKRFRRLFAGKVANITQALSWPRIGVVVQGEEVKAALPLPVAQAVCEYALIALSGPLMKVFQNREKVSRSVGAPGVSLGEGFRWTQRNTRTQQSSIVADVEIPSYPQGDLLLEAYLGNVEGFISPVVVGNLNRRDRFDRDQFTSPYRPFGSAVGFDPEQFYGPHFGAW